MPKVKNQKQNNDSGLNFEAQLWAAADKMRGHIDASEYKHVVLGLSFRTDLHPDLKADFILANPPSNMSDWDGENLRQDVRWKFGMPPVNNANYAWIQHFLHHLSPVGVAGFVMANGSMSTQTSNEGEIRKAIIEADLVDCIVALPPSSGRLFPKTKNP